MALSLSYFVVELEYMSLALFVDLCFFFEFGKSGDSTLVRRRLDR